MIGRLRARARAAIVTANEHDVALAFGHAGRDRADANLGHEFHGNARIAIRVLQIVDQLREIFDRIDVVVRRRRDQAHARRAIADARDLFVDLVAGQLSAFARLGPLGHFDLQFLGALHRYSLVTPNRPLATCLMAPRAAVAVGVGLKANRIFASFARIALAADAVHGDGPASRALRARSIRTTIAPVANRLTISFASSTSSSGTGWAGGLNSSRPRKVSNCRC